jgi:hypothetical protein
MMKAFFLAVFLIPSLVFAQANPPAGGPGTASSVVVTSLPALAPGANTIGAITGVIGNYLNGGVTLGDAPTLVFAAAGTPARLRLHLLNTTYATSTGTPIAIWCAYGAIVPAPHAPTSFPLYPGGGIDDASPGPVSQAAVSCVAEAAGATLYAEQF